MAATEPFGPYRLRRRIALGGAAEVFAAELLADEAPAADDDDAGDAASAEPTTLVALKRLGTAAAATPAMVAQLRGEGDLLVHGLAPHPHVVRGHRLGAALGRDYIEMELVLGVDLRVLVERGDDRPLPAGVATRLALDVGAAASHLCASGVVHGDINPSNILVRRDGVAKLCDFGVAVMPARAAAGPVRGTPGYMSPEQVRGEAIDHRTDVFALAVVLWELLAGRRLFHRGASWLTLAAVVEAEAPPLPAELGAPVGLDALLAAALAKEAGVRIPDSATFTGELERTARAGGWDLGRDAIAARVARP